MITQVSLRNVRLFADDLRTFRLTPLTVFCGSNSSGKSTILKIFPLLRQSQGIRESAEEESGKLRFKGTQVDLGNYYTLVSNNDTSRRMHVGIRVGNQVNAHLLAFLRFVKEKRTAQFAPGGLPDKLVNYELECSFEFFAESPSPPNAPSAKTDKLTGGGLLKAEFAMIANGEVLLAWSVESLERVRDKLPIVNPFTEEGSQRMYKFRFPTPFFESMGMAEKILPQESERPEETTLTRPASRGVPPASPQAAEFSRLVQREICQSVEQFFERPPQRKCGCHRLWFAAALGPKVFHWKQT